MQQSLVVNAVTLVGGVSVVVVVVVVMQPKPHPVFNMHSKGVGQTFDPF
jgi:hypothetical protein